MYARLGISVLGKVLGRGYAEGIVTRVEQRSEKICILP